MKNPPKIALVSDDADINLHFIRQVLQHRRIPFLHLNPIVKRRNFDLSIHSDSDGRSIENVVIKGDIKYKLNNIRSVWSRGAAYSGGHATTPGTSENLIYHESVYSFEYIWWSLRKCLWINPLLNAHAARNRLIQHEIAAKCGMRVPRQTVTTLGSGVADLAAQGKSRIIKNISQGGYQESGPCFNKTEYFREECADGISSERLSAPVMLQEYIEKDYEIRAVVIGATVYGAAVDSASSEMTSLDSRYWGKAGLTYYRIRISDNERDVLVKINQLLGLSYSAMDLIRGRDGALYFLEANPSGQWGFVEMLTGFPITEKIVDLLESSS